MGRRRFRSLLAAAALLAVTPMAPAAAADDQVAASVAASHDGEYLDLPDDPLRGAAFVTQGYRDLLGRDPDADGLAFWAEQLDGGVAATEMMALFVDSPEFAGTRAPVARLYLAAYGRLPDRAGWEYWAGQRQAGATLRALAAEFLAADEAIQRFGGTDDPDRMIEAFYDNVLGRPPDGPGADYWRGQLATGVTPAEILLAFAESPEFARSAEPSIQAALLYVGLLDRDGDPAGLRHWTDVLADGAPYGAVVAGFLDSAEYRQRLTGIWCRIFDEAEIEIFDGPNPPTFDAAYREMDANATAILSRYSLDRYDAVVSAAVDDHPDPQLVLYVHEPRVEHDCLTLLAPAPYPRRVAFVRAPFSRLEKDTARHEASEFARANGAWLFSGGGLTRFDLGLSSAGLPIADEILTRWGIYIDELTVGAFPYPMPDPLPRSFCAEEPADIVEPSDLDLVVTVDPPAAVVAGASPLGSFTVENVGTTTQTVTYGAEVTAYLGSGPTARSAFVGFVNLPLSVRPVAPGESITVPLLLGTDACDPADGHRLPPGPLPLFGAFAVDNGPDPHPSSPDVWVRLPPVTVTLTH